MNKTITVILVGIILIISLVGNAYRIEKSKPLVISKCQAEIDNLNYQLNQCRMIRGQ